eukprot:NODE_2690_length_455_cov_135.632530_g2669_i0.p1 GENE.NODE_2690_length_455_cov_135.632530_g2669_i0~~NODE_2690_length_455_cov_135.632530_g2669_i0.p1  ORF type:complete len:120 (-),score=4.87 NODE_2690_length_455_cov_135.632530_g2669_i0:60-419(-)
MGGIISRKPDNVTQEDTSPGVTGAYTFTSHWHACFQGCGCGPAADDNNHIPGGGVFLILLTIVIVLYVVGGGIFNKVQYSSEGWQLCPHYAFWIDLPNLVQAGFLVLFSCKRTQYEAAA